MSALVDINPRFHEHREYRVAVRELCARFGSDYWQDVDARAAYPDAFVAALTEAGWLAALIPEAYGAHDAARTGGEEGRRPLDVPRGPARRRTARSHGAADLMRYEAARLFDAGQPVGAEANMAELLAADASWEAANVCLQTFGGFGFAAEYDVERKFRETRLYQVAPVSTNLILSYIGEHVLGLPRSF